MIRFDINKLVVEHCKIKAITMAMGGSMSVLDVDATEKKGKDVFRRVSLPLAVARAFQVQHKVSNFFSAVTVAVTKYDGNIVAVELRPLTITTDEVQGVFGKRSWISVSESNMTTVEKTVKDGCWYIDGSYLYKMPEKLQELVDSASLLSSDKMFRTIKVPTLKLMDIGVSEYSANPKLRTSRRRIVPEFIMKNRSVLIVVAKNGQFAITPPIWKDLDTFGNTHLNKMKKSGEEIDKNEFRFDLYERTFAVNLSFALSAGKSIGEMFGYKSVEPLQLSRLMLKLNTVNLPNIDKSVKATYDIGMSFKVCMAWLVGKLLKVNTLEELIVVRNAIKYLCTKGVYREEIFTPKHLYKDGFDGNNVEVMSTDQALETADSKVTWDVLQTRITTKRRIGYNGLVA